MWDGVVRDDGMTMDVPSLGLIRLGAAALPGPAVLGVRAERILIATIPDANQMTGVPERTVYAGDIVTHSIRLYVGTTVQVVEPTHDAASREGTVTLSFPPSACMVFPP